MKIETRIDEGVALLLLDGNLTAGDGERSFSDQLQRLIDEGHRSIVVDMDRVTHVDSSGLGALVRCHTSCQRASGTLRLRRVRPQLASLLAIARLDDVLELEE